MGIVPQVSPAVLRACRYQDLARQAELLADMASTSEIRAGYLDAAKFWRELALEVMERQKASGSELSKLGEGYVENPIA